MIVHEVEQRSDEWYALRAGMPTASEFSKIVTSKGEPSKSANGYAITLANELYAGRPVDAWEGNDFTERGRELEGEAIANYEFMFDADIETVGFVTDDASSMGCSPDGFVGTDGLIEIKCLKAENHTDAILYFQKHSRCLPKYVQQAQGQMLLTERKWCDLVFYHPILPQLVIRQTPDEAVINGLQEQLPLLRAERDRVLNALLEHAGEKRIAA